jgi:glutamate--cysteine ligase
MTHPEDRFSEVAAETFVARTCFKTGPPQAVGIELEWLLNHRDDPRRPVTEADLAAAQHAAAHLRHSRMSVEPGGQVELSSEPFGSPGSCVESVRTDLLGFRAALLESGLVLTGIGLDPWRAPRRLLTEPRYAAMERYFDRRGRAGRVMMCSTAAVQVNVDAGPAEPTAGQVDLATRWDLLHALTPVLVGAFANSPVRAGRPTGWRSTRQRVWRAIDPARTTSAHRPGEDPRRSWARYALAAPVMCIPDDSDDWRAPEGLGFGDWVRTGSPRPPGEPDLAYHLTTLFPPVRPRGHLELRVIDAQRTDADWTAAFALVTALLDDPAAAERARAALEPVSRPRWATVAARDGLSDPVLAKAAIGCFEAALDALAATGFVELRTELAAFTARYPDRARCPADDTLADLVGPASRPPKEAA